MPLLKAFDFDHSDTCPFCGGLMRHHAYTEVYEDGSGGYCSIVKSKGPTQLVTKKKFKSAQ